MLSTDPLLANTRRQKLDACLRGAVDAGDRLVCGSASRYRSSMRPEQQLVEGPLPRVGDRHKRPEAGCDDYGTELVDIKTSVRQDQVGASRLVNAMVSA